MNSHLSLSKLAEQARAGARHADGRAGIGPTQDAGLSPAEPTRRLRWGRSKASMLLITSRHVHLFAWAPKLGADSYGFTLRYRRGSDWTHYRVIAFQHGKRQPASARGKHSNRGGQHFMARPTLTLLEIARWQTVNGTQQRHDLKAYVRIKVGPGGRQL